MNYLELAHKIHQNAVDKGFWDEERPVRHYLMLAICELCEAIEADREGRRASYPSGLDDFPDEAFVASFRTHIKDTLEDELADTVIRLLDLWGEYLPSKELRLPQPKTAVDKPLTEVGHMITSLLSDYVPEDRKELHTVIVSLRRDIRCAICWVYSYATLIGIDLDRHILLKMRYNASRPRLHGKKY